MSTFTDADEEKLINAVAGHPMIYDTSNPNYRSNVAKDNVWIAIGKDLNKNSDECKKKWKSIRDGYHRFKKKHHLGSAAPKQSKDKRHLMLSFLDGLPQPRSGGSNIPPSPQSTEDDPLRVTSEEQEVSKDGLTSFTEQASNNDDVTNAEVANYAEVVHNADVANNAEVANHEEKHLVVKKKTYLKLWKERHEKRQTLMKSILKKKDDDIDLFVRHIGEVLRKLPQVEKAQAKKHLYVVLSDYEIRAAKNLSIRESSSSVSDISSPPNSPGPGARTVPDHQPGTASSSASRVAPLSDPGPNSAPHQDEDLDYFVV